MPVLEVKARRIGGATYQVPIEVRADRRQALALRWLVQYARLRGGHSMAENLANEIIVEMIPVEFEVKGKGIQHFYGVVNMPNFNIEQFFKQGDPSFEADSDCIKAVGPTGPKTLNEVRVMLGIPIPEFEKVDLNAEENKIQAK